LECWEVVDIEGEVQVTWEIISTFGLRTGSVYPRKIPGAGLPLVLREIWIDIRLAAEQRLLFFKSFEAVNGI